MGLSAFDTDAKSIWRPLEPKMIAERMAGVLGAESATALQDGPEPQGSSLQSRSSKSRPYSYRARMRPTRYGAAGVRWPPRFNHSPPRKDDQYDGIEYPGLPVKLPHIRYHVMLQGI